MTKKFANVIVSYLKDLNYNASIYENYSGRAMYGETTVAVTIEENIPIGKLMEVYLLIGKDYKNQFIEETANLRTDNFGKGIVLY